MKLICQVVFWPLFLMQDLMVGAVQLASAVMATLWEAAKVLAVLAVYLAELSAGGVNATTD